MKRTALVLSVAFCLIFLSTAVFAEKATDNKSSGQTVYVAASYNHCANSLTDQYNFSKVSIRNVDPNYPITLTRVTFYGQNAAGDVDIIEMLGDPVVPVVIEGWGRKIYSTTSGLGIPAYECNEGNQTFIVEWEAENKVIEPIIVGVQFMFNWNTGEVSSMVTYDGRIIEEK